MFELAPFDLPEDYGQGIVPLADIKAWCSIDEAEDEFDGLLGFMRDAAVDMVERYCGVYLALREGVVWTGEVIPAKFRLPYRPAIEITGFAYFDYNGASATFDVAGLRLTAGSELRTLAGAAWPSGEGYEVTFSAGYTDANRPPALVTAVKMFAAHLFANREAVITGTISGEIPLGFQTLCRQFRPVLI